MTVPFLTAGGTTPTTRAALVDGSCAFVFVAAIEGHDSLYTNGSPAAAVAAWAGTDWTTARDGLHVDLTIDQKLDPDAPLVSMGSCTLWIQDSGDAFGVAIHRKGGGAETYLDTTLDRNDTTVTVKSTAAFASSGEAHIGTECFAYTGKTGTTFTGCTRGKYSPFLAGGSETAHFAHEHRVALDSNSVKLQPIVSSLPRTWRGKFVSIYLHRLVAGVLDVKAEAECVFAGTIGDTRDDSQTGATVIQLTPISEWIGNRVLGSGQWEATVSEGVYLEAGQGFALSDGTSAPLDEANELVVTSSLFGANYMPPGVYSLSNLCSRLNTWFASEKTAARINFTYTIHSPFQSGLVQRTLLNVTLDSAIGSSYRLEMPVSVAKFFGFRENVGPTDGNVAIELLNTANTGSWPHVSTYPPLRMTAPLDGGSLAVCETTTTTGEFADQRGTMPYSIRPVTTLSLEWGLFVIGDSQLILAAKEGNNLTHMRLWKGLGESKDEPESDPHVSFSAEDGRSLRVRQVLAIEYEFATAMLCMFMSTGTTSYNETFFDILPRGLSIGLPLGLVGDDFVAEIPGTAGSVAIIIDKPKKFSEVIESDLLIRWAYLRWVNGTMRFGAWKTPSAADATYTLDETTKAEAEGVVSPQRSATEESADWLKAIVKIEFNRDVAKLGDGGDYQSSLMFEDRVAVDDQGGAGKVHTISLSNTFTDFAATGQSAESLLPVYMANMPLISKPARRVDRSIDPRYFWRISIGETVLFTDSFARDPATGTRGIADRPALVTRHTFRLGGLTKPGTIKPEKMGGRVTLFFADQDPDRSAAAYVPSGDIDDTAISGGFSAGYNSSTSTIRLYEHRYSESTESVDASHLGTVGHKLLIVEKDALDPTNPVSWERTVDSTSGSDITFTAALSSPAWDAAKKYRVSFQDYDTAATAQKAKSYQADDADGLILDTTGPFFYGSSSADPTYTANSSTDVELVPTMTYADGAGRDVGTEVAIIRQIDNFVDYKSAIHSPMLFNTVVSNTTTASGSYLLVAYWPIFLSLEILSNNVFRHISCAPWAYSTDGTSTKIRVSLCRDRPSGSSLTDHDRGAVFASAEWTGITSTTPAVLTATTTLTANVKHPFTGVAYVMLELGLKCATRGIARFVESSRQLS